MLIKTRLCGWVKPEAVTAIWVTPQTDGDLPAVHVIVDRQRGSLPFDTEEEAVEYRDELAAQINAALS